MAVDGIVGANYLLTRIGNSYEKEDCVHAVVINLIRKNKGGNILYRTAGCTELWNSYEKSGKYHHITQRLTLDEAKRQGLKIGDLPVIYNASTGKCEHIAYYMGGIGGYECIHSSASRGEVCGTTLRNGFTHVLRHKDIAVRDVSDAKKQDTQTPDEPAQETGGAQVMETKYTVRVNTDGEGSLNLRKRPSTTALVLVRVPFGSAMQVLEETSDSWLKVTYQGYVGYVSRPLTARDDEFTGHDEEVGGEEYIAPTTFGVFIPCDSKEAADAMLEAFGRCYVHSVCGND